ncbi:MAG: hypothetical protein J7K73_03265 [Nanoarchaeota archaeon]|nr:hypothetical protein [Nanoarchaeota archaeon]
MNVLRDIEEVFDKFPQKGAFGFVGIFGSINPTHDIDMLSIRNPYVPRKEFIKANLDLMLALKDYQIKKGRDVSPFPTEYIQPFIEYFKEPRDILVHNLAFLDYPSFDRLNPKDFKKIIEKEMIVLYGSLDVLDHPLLQQEHRKNDPYIQALNFAYFIANLPPEFRTKTTKFAIKQITKNSLRMPEYHENLPSGEWTIEECVNQYSRVLDLIEARQVA